MNNNIYEWIYSDMPACFMQLALEIVVRVGNDLKAAGQCGLTAGSRPAELIYTLARPMAASR
jgi:hypothetical protein